MRDDNNNYILYNMLQGRPNNIGDLGNSVFQLGYFQNEDHIVGYNAMEKADNTIDKLFSSEDFNKIKLLYFFSERFMNKMADVSLEKMSDILISLTMEALFNLRNKASHSTDLEVLQILSSLMKNIDKNVSYSLKEINLIG